MRDLNLDGYGILEGIVVKNENKYAIAINKPNKKIEIIEGKIDRKIGDKLKNILIIRGIVEFAISLHFLVKTFLISSNYIDEDGKTDKKNDIKETIFFILSLLISAVVFIAIPYYLSLIFKTSISSDIVLTIIEGIIRICLLTFYIVGISIIGDVQRVYGYYAAINKVLNCIDRKLPLSISNIRRMKIKRANCTMSFMVSILFISIVFFMFIRIESIFLRLFFRILMVLFLIGISYEIINITKNNKNSILSRILLSPGYLLQSILTKEPTDNMLELAVVTLERVFDWKLYLGIEEVKETLEIPVRSKRRSRRRRRVDGRKRQVDERIEREILETKPETQKEIKTIQEEPKRVYVEMPKAEPDKSAEEIKNTKVTRLKSRVVPIKNNIEIKQDENDEILNALDYFFNSKNDKKANSR